MMVGKGSPPSVGPSRSLEDEQRSGSRVEAVFCALLAMLDPGAPKVGPPQAGCEGGKTASADS